MICTYCTDYQTPRSFVTPLLVRFPAKWNNYDEDPNARQFT